MLVFFHCAYVLRDSSKHFTWILKIYFFISTSSPANPLYKKNELNITRRASVLFSYLNHRSQ